MDARWKTGNIPKRKREGKDPDVEDALNQWFSIMTGRGVRVRGPMLKKKSEKLAKKQGRDDFKATDGWLSRWKCRHDTKFKKAHGEKDSAEVVFAEEWKSKKVPRNFVQMVSTVLMKQACFIVSRRVVLYATSM
jgi:hypothetical protein